MLEVPDATGRGLAERDGPRWHPAQNCHEEDAMQHKESRTTNARPERRAAAARVRTEGATMLRRALADESGSATAEYAVATMAAVGFAGLLVLILRGDEVRGILTDLVRRALTVAG